MESMSRGISHAVRGFPASSLILGVIVLCGGCGTGEKKDAAKKDTGGEPNTASQEDDQKALARRKEVADLVEQIAAQRAPSPEQAQRIQKLSDMNSAEVRAVLADLVKGGAENEDARVQALSTLGQLAEPLEGDEKDRMRATIRKAIRDESPLVREKALQVLGHYRDPYAKEVAKEWIASGHNLEKRQAIIAMCQMDMKEHIPEVRALLKSESPVIRGCAIRALGYWRDEQSRAAIEEAANSKDKVVADMAKVALAQLGGASTGEGQPKKPDF